LREPNSTRAFLKTHEADDDSVTTYMSCFSSVLPVPGEAGGMRTGRDRFGLLQGVKKAYFERGAASVVSVSRKFY